MRRGRARRRYNFLNMDMVSSSSNRTNSNSNGPGPVEDFPSLLETVSLREVHNGVRAAQTERFLDSLARGPDEVGGADMMMGSAKPQDYPNDKLKVPAKGGGGRRQVNGRCDEHHQVTNLKPHSGGRDALKAAGFVSSSSSSSPDDQGNSDGAGSGGHAGSSSCHDKGSIFSYPFPADPLSKKRSTQGSDLKRDIGKYMLFNAIDVELNPPPEEAEELMLKTSIKTEPGEEQFENPDLKTLLVVKPEIPNEAFVEEQQGTGPSGATGGDELGVGCGCKLSGWSALVDHLIQDHQFEVIDIGDDEDGGEWTAFIPVDAIERKLSHYRVIRYLGRYFLFCMIPFGDVYVFWIYRLSNKANDVGQEESYFRYYLHFVDWTETHTLTFTKNCVPWSKNYSQVLHENLCLSMTDLTTSLFVRDKYGSVNLIIYGKLYPGNPLSTIPENRTSSMESLVDGVSDECYDVTGLIDDMPINYNSDDKYASSD